jgi:hypothetical protein
MEYVPFLALIVFCGFINRIRGHGDINRLIFDLSNFLISLVSFKDIYLSVIIAIGIRIWLVAMEEVKSIDWITTKIYKEPTDYKSARNWGTIGMALRGFSMSIPLFIGLAWYLGNPWLSLLSMPMLLQGPIYRIVHDDYYGTVRVKRLINYGQAEMLTGFLYGLLTSIAILCQ